MDSKQPLFNAGLLVAGSGLLAVLAIAQVPPPFLKIAPVSNTQFQISITNAVASTNYEIYRSSQLLTTNLWSLYSVGSIGQSNFIVGMDELEIGFFKAAVGSDWDLDGVPNSMDANPLDPTIGALTITIDSPTNGMTLN